MILHVAALAGYEVIAIVKHDGQVEAARQLGAAHVVQTTAFARRSRRRARSRPRIAASISPLRR
jgi:D-arabinose 1-dehydrogenase-like Zn-dependent alcohol dehydrogenase